MSIVPKREICSAIFWKMHLTTKRQCFWLFSSIHRVVTIDGREDLARHLLMNGYLTTTDPPKSNDKREHSGNNFDALVKRMANVGIAPRYRRRYHEGWPGLLYSRSCDHRSLALSVHVAGRFHLQQNEEPTSCIWCKGVLSTCFQEERQSLHSLSCMHQIKISLVVQAMHDILEGSVIISVSSSESF